MMVREVGHAEVKKFARLASAERVVTTTNDKCRWYMAYAGGSPGWRIGFGCLMDTGKSVRIRGVYVFHESRGCGQGTAFTEELIQRAKASGKSVDAFAYNPEFYTERGFAVAGKPNRAGAVHVVLPPEQSQKEEAS